MSMLHRLLCCLQAIDWNECRITPCNCWSSEIALQTGWMKYLRNTLQYLLGTGGAALIEVLLCTGAALMVLHWWCCAPVGDVWKRFWQVFARGSVRDKQSKLLLWLPPNELVLSKSTSA